MLKGFIAAAQGATLITTSCGFLARYQAAMSEALPVPVITSSLLLCANLPQPIVLTINANSLTTELPQAAGVPPESHFRQQIPGNQPTLDLARAEAELVALVNDLKTSHPAAQNLVLECTNLPPYAQALAEASGLSVHHLMTAIARYTQNHPA